MSLESLLDIFRSSSVYQNDTDRGLFASQMCKRSSGWGSPGSDGSPSRVRQCGRRVSAVSGKRRVGLRSPYCSSSSNPGCPLLLFIVGTGNRGQIFLQLNTRIIVYLQKIYFWPMTFLLAFYPSLELFMKTASLARWPLTALRSNIASSSQSDIDISSFFFFLEITLEGTDSCPSLNFKQYLIEELLFKSA